MSTKMGWATFWAIFSQTHLVTLAETILRSVLPQEWLKAGLNESILHWIRSLGRRACKMKNKCFSNKKRLSLGQNLPVPEQGIVLRTRDRML
jgi:hypothetical protein